MENLGKLSEHLKKMSRKELSTIKGGFACYCGSTYKGEYSSIKACAAACGVKLEELETAN